MKTRTLSLVAETSAKFTVKQGSTLQGFDTLEAATEHVVEYMRVWSKSRAKVVITCRETGETVCYKLSPKTSFAHWVEVC